MIRSEAQGVRKLDSKLRYSLQDFSLVELSLVLGREKWRIVSVALIKNVSADLRGDISSRAILSRIASLIGRLLTGEEKNEKLFEHVKNGLMFITERHPVGKVLQNFEYLLVLRILHSLGYLGSSPDWSTFTKSPSFDTELLVRMEESKRQAIAAINHSLKATHL